MLYSKDQGFNIQALKIDGCEILNYFAIPSSINIMNCDSITYEELSKINQNQPSFYFQAKTDDNDVEKSIKDIIPKYVHV
jgi:thiamine pyrophosphokinase